MGAPARMPHPSDVSDDKWEFLAPDLRLTREDAPRRESPSRELFNGLRRLVKTGAQRRDLPNDFPPRAAVYPQARRWAQAGAFEGIADELCMLLSVLQGRSDRI
jgi:transposase